MSKKYSETFKKRAIEKALTRGNGVSMDKVCNDIGVASGTLYHWIEKSRKSGFIKNTASEKRPQDWNTAEKLQVLIESGSLTEENLNSYCRRNGLYKHHIEQWKADMASTNTNPDKAEMRALREENKKLKKELRRKDKALAETAALLVLQKKVEEIWGSRDEED